MEERQSVAADVLERGEVLQHLPLDADEEVEEEEDIRIILVVLEEEEDSEEAEDFRVINHHINLPQNQIGSKMSIKTQLQVRIEQGNYLWRLCNREI